MSVSQGAAVDAEQELRDDVTTFDVLPPLNSRGRESSVERLNAWFDTYDGPIDYTAQDVQVSASDDLGFCSYLYHVAGTLKSGSLVDMWVRATLCWRRIDGRWRIVHDHESVPFDPATGRAALSLEPQ